MRGPQPWPGRAAFILAALVTASLTEVAAQPSPRSAELGVAERVYGLSLIWMEARYNFPYFGHLELDWDSAYRASVPRVVSAESTLEYYRELQRFTALLQDGHTRVQMPDSILRRQPFASPWVELEAVAGRPIVRNVATTLLDSLPVGSEILRVDGLAVEEYLERSVLPYVFASAPHSRLISAIEGSHSRGYGLLVGPSAEPLRVAARTPSNDTVRLTLERDRFRVERQWARPTGVRAEPLVVLDWPTPTIAYLAVNGFGHPAVVSGVDSLLPQLRRASGIVMDLRRNGGGSDVIAAQVIARFTPAPLVGSASRVRVHDAYLRALGSFGRAALERALPAGDSALVEQSIRHHAGEAWRVEAPDTVHAVFDGERLTVPVAILIGRGTASAAENLLIGLLDQRQFFMVGTATAGSTGQPLRFPLPGGGEGQVVTRAALLPDGSPLTKTGIEPDYRVEPTLEQVLRGIDAVLARAVVLLQSAVAR